MAFPCNNSWHNPLELKENTIKENAGYFQLSQTSVRRNAGLYQDQVETELPMGTIKNFRFSGRILCAWDLHLGP